MSETELRVERTEVEGVCGSCGAEALARYPVLSEGGWFMAIKCQRCLTSVDREPWDLYGPIALTSHGLSLG
jgi:hypothetical protein